MAGRPSKELRMFEAMENFTLEESFDSAASFVRKFVGCKLDLNNTNQTIPDADLSHLTIPSAASSDCEGDCSNVDSSPHVRNNEDNAGSQDDEDSISGDRSSKGTSVQEDEEEQEEDEDDDDYSEVDEEEEEGDKENDESVVTYSQSDEDDISPATHDTSLTSVSKATVVKSTGALNRRGGASVYILLSEIKRSLELQEQKLEREKQSFQEQQKSDQSKLQAEKQRVEFQKKNLQRLVADYHKMKHTKDEHESQLKDLTEKLRNTKLEMNKRISRWTEQQRKLEDRVKVLEKENTDLKKQKSVAQRPSNLKRPPMITRQSFVPKPPIKSLQPAKRIHFADDTEKKSPNSSLSSKVPVVPRNSKSPLPDEGEGAAHGSKPGVSQVAEDDEESAGQLEVSLDDSFADKTMPSDYIEVKHPCGTITRITKDNKFVRHVLVNNDIMDELEDCSVRYYYKELGFSQITFPNGDEIIEYDSGVLETIRADGSKIYTFSDGVVKLVDTVGIEEVYFGDGSVMKKQTNGECIITWPSGQKEVRTSDYAKRVFPNGTVKILYTDGSEETRYWNGRVRRKDKNGKLVDDTKHSKKVGDKSANDGGSV